METPKPPQKKNKRKSMLHMPPLNDLRRDFEAGVPINVLEKDYKMSARHITLAASRRRWSKAKRPNDKQAMLRGEEFKLTPLQRLFVENYNGDPAAAAIAAGYNRKVAIENTEWLMRQPKIVLALHDKKRRAGLDRVADKRDRQTFWTSIMTDPDVEINFRLKASELLGKSFGDFVERRVIEGSDDRPVRNIVQVQMLDPVLNSLGINPQEMALLDHNKPNPEFASSFTPSDEDEESAFETEIANARAAKK